MASETNTLREALERYQSEGCYCVVIGFNGDKGEVGVDTPSTGFPMLNLFCAHAALRSAIHEFVQTNGEAPQEAIRALSLLDPLVLKQRVVHHA